MKQFSIAINSEKQYNKVKAYAEKWGYKRINNENVITKGWLMIYKDKTFNDNNFPLDKSVYIEVKDNWKKLIRKNSPLTIENTYLEIDTVEKVKAVWDVIKDGGKPIYVGTIDEMSKGLTSEGNECIIFSENEFIRDGKKSYTVTSKTLITPKQLAQILGVKKSTKEMLKKVESKTHSGYCYEDPSLALKGAEMPKILDTEDLVTRKEFKEYNSKLRKRIYDFESKLSEPVNLTVNLSKDIKPVFQYDKPKSLTIPKIAIRVENEHEFDELMKIYEVLGWKWLSGSSCTKFSYKDCIVHGECILKFSDNFILINKFSKDEFSKNGYTIIPLSQIKGLK